MKKIISLLTAVLLISSFSVTILATDGTSSGSKSGSEIRLANLQEQKQRLENQKAKLSDMLAKNEKLRKDMAAFETFKNALREKRATLIENRIANKTIMVENKQLRIDLAKSLEAIKENGTVLSEDTLLQLSVYNAQIKDIITAIKETKGDINLIATKYRGFMSTKDFAAMEIAFDEVYAIQQWRNDQLKQINVILTDMTKLLASVI